ncbi:Dynein heavy chain-like protein [Colletotrichum fructicola]|nr:Dynein heavy chain-like protein [Colletotrichum fructicola]KAF4930857.1 Dynein heavy chain-like protein [Colletotrichum fructicola]KAF5483607.1 Dynein heavy chain-like protein [Colletotrichum fructicola]
MLRSSRQLLRLAPRSAAAPSAASPASFSTRASPSALQSSRRPSVALQARLSPLSLVARYTNSPYDKIDKKAEAEIAKKKLESDPEHVSTESSTRHVFEPAPANPERDQDLQKGLKEELNIVKDTFNLSEVPREPYALGLAGTLPYLATSLSTMYLSWDINLEWPSSSTFANNIYMNQESAQYWLSLLEPIQLGYGAIIISFLGAVHWGMEYSEKTPSATRTKFRYGMGVLAPMLAWPTLLMPIEYALTAQFGAFTFLYLADTRAKNRGWTPQWYGTYRFILTAIVGVSIFISLVGRTKIGNAQPHIGQELAESKHWAKTDKTRDWDKLEEEERERIKKEKEEEEKKKKEEEKKQKAEEKKAKKGGKSKKEEKGAEKKDDSEEDESNSESESKDESKDGSEDEKSDEGKDEKKEKSKGKEEKSSGEEDDSKDEKKDTEKEDKKDEAKGEKKDEAKGEKKDKDDKKAKDEKKDDKEGKKEKKE